MTTHYKYNRATIREAVSFIGVGLHTGKTAQVTLKPSVDARGIYFVRKDVNAGTGVIDAQWYNVSDTTLSTNLSNEHGVSVHTVEHLMSALLATGIDNVRIEIDRPEVPIMDGSAEIFVRTTKYREALSGNAKGSHLGDSARGHYRWRQIRNIDTAFCSAGYCLY